MPNRVNNIIFALEGDAATNQIFLTITLPSGRKLYYAQPAIGANRFGGESVIFTGIDQEKKKWTALETYGAKIVENCIQAIARDCLAESLIKLSAAGYNTVMHVHDEVVIDCPAADCDVGKICDIMGEPIAWAPGLSLRADGFVTDFYKKD